MLETIREELAQWQQVKVLTQLSGWCWLTTAPESWREQWPADKYLFTVEGTGYKRGYKKLEDVLACEMANTDWIKLTTSRGIKILPSR